MTIRLRFIRVIAPLGGLALLLAGCMQLHMSLTVNADDTVDGQLLLTAEQSLLTSGGKTLEQGFADLRQNIPALPPGEETVYKDQKKYGATIAYTKTPLSKFNSESIKLVKNNGTYRFTLPLDPKLYGGKFATTSPQNQETFMKLMSFEIQITFPGRVLASNGTEIGQTVSWQVKANEPKPAELTATAEIPAVATATAAAGQSGTGGGFPWPLLAGGVVVLLGIAVTAVLLLRRPGTASPPEAGSPEPSSTTSTG
jgi:hypothetical protein